jgi:hypothetical protein
MERLSVEIEFLAFSAMVLHFPWSGCPRPAVQLAQPSASYQPVVIPAPYRVRGKLQPESRLLLTAFWIPACAGMTDQHLSEKGNLDKTVHINKLNFQTIYDLPKLPFIKRLPFPFHKAVGQFAKNNGRKKEKFTVLGHGLYNIRQPLCIIAIYVGIQNEFQSQSP